MTSDTETPVCWVGGNHGGRPYGHSDLFWMWGGMECSSAAGIPTVMIQSGDIRTTATSLARSAGGMASFWFRETCDSVAAKT